MTVNVGTVEWRVVGIEGKTAGCLERGIAGVIGYIICIIGRVRKRCIIVNTKRCVVVVIKRGAVVVICAERGIIVGRRGREVRIIQNREQIRL